MPPKPAHALLWIAQDGGIGLKMRSPSNPAVVAAIFCLPVGD